MQNETSCGTGVARVREPNVLEDDTPANGAECGI
jgi:hypothetical protein